MFEQKKSKTEVESEHVSQFLLACSYHCLHCPLGKETSTTLSITEGQILCWALVLQRMPGPRLTLGQGLANYSRGPNPAYHLSFYGLQAKEWFLCFLMFLKN